MSEKQILLPDELQEIDFYGDMLIVACVDNQAYVALKPITGYLGLAWSAQYRRLMRDEVLGKHAASIVMAGADSKQREMVCLEVEYLPGWLFGITPNRAKPELVSRLRRYRERCFRVLWQVFQTEQMLSACDGEELDQMVHRWMSGLGQKVRAQCLRAERAGVPATLTLEQWLNTLEFFNWKCAYCQKRYGVIIEHFVPIPYGGTTVDNCVPSCYVCNGKKGSSHPDHVITIPGEVLNGVRCDLHRFGEMFSAIRGDVLPSLQ